MRLIRKGAKSLASLFILYLIVNAFLFSSATHAVASAPVTVDVPVVNDFYVDNSGNYPLGDAQYNARSGNWVGNAIDPFYGEAKAAVKFDLSSLPEKASISSAQLKIYVNAILGTPDLLSVWGSHTNQWDDNQITMISQDERLIDYNGAITDGQWITVPVTNFVQSRMAADKVVSLVLTGNTTGDASFNFNSKESADSAKYGPANRPVLSVTYAIKNTNADLGSLTVSNATLSPDFDPAVTSYSAAVANEVASVNITPALVDSAATVKVNGIPVESGSAVSVDLSVGSNSIVIEATAEDGITAKTYTLMIDRIPSGNANLATLQLDQGTLNERFDPNQTMYTSNVPYAVNHLQVTSTTADSTASVQMHVGATAYANGQPIPLGVGETQIIVTVTTQDGSVKTYTLSVNRAPASTNAALSNLVIDETELAPSFSPERTSYAASVAFPVGTVHITSTLADSLATLQVQGNATTSGNAVAVPVHVGSNTITLEVTAEDRVTKEAYTIEISRSAQSANANLRNLSIAPGTLSPAFEPEQVLYSAHVDADSLNITPTVSDSSATVTVNGEAAKSGSPIHVGLGVGFTTITVVVTAPDGTEKTYTVKVDTTKPDVNIHELQEKVDAIDAENLREGSYKPASWKRLADALEAAKAIFKMPDVTQADVDAALAELNAAREGLKPVEAPAPTLPDKSALKAAMDQIAAENLRATDYTAASWQALMSALENAAQVFANPSATQNEVDLALSELKKARKSMTEQADTVDKSKLEEKVDAITDEDLQEDDYTKDSWEALQDALAQARDVLTDPNATQAEVDTALSALKKARQGLTESSESVDKSRLEAKVEQIVDEDLEEEDYTKSSWRKLKKALEHAEDVLDDRNATQSEIDEALNELKKARRELKRSKENDGGGSGGDRIKDRDREEDRNATEMSSVFGGNSNGPATSAGTVLNTPATVEQKATQPGYVNGYPDGSFQPDRTVTHAEMAMILINAGMVQRGSIENDAFMDVAGSYWADGTFQPSGDLTRAEMAAIILKYMQLSGGGSVHAFTDVAADHWSAQIIAAVVEKGVMAGYPDGTFQPDKPLTRAEAVTILNRVLNRVPQSDGGMQIWPDVDPSHWAYKEIQAASMKESE